MELWNVGLWKRLRVKFAYLSSAESNHQVSDEGVLRLSGAMADHHAPTVRLSQFTPESQTDRLL